jgi:hypothetical protein
MNIKIKVTPEKFDEHFSIDDWFNFDKLTNVELYNIILLFVVDDEGNEVPLDKARAMFKKVSKKEWPEYINAFYKAISDGFVSPTNGGS